MSVTVNSIPSARLAPLMEEWKRLYENGHTILEIAKQFSSSKVTVLMHLHRMRVTMRASQDTRRSRRLDEILPRIVEEYRAGANIDDLAQKWATKKPTIYARFRAMGVALESRAQYLNETKADQHIRLRYGMSRQAYNALLEKQGGGCAICGGGGGVRKGTRALQVDHDHVTGRVRGLLCGDCNRALGSFCDRDDLCLRAAEYLLQEYELPIASQEWLDKHPRPRRIRRVRTTEFHRLIRAKGEYGLTWEQYVAYLEQGYKNGCAICATGKEDASVQLHVDHDHKAGRVRAMLCGLCNRGLGKFKEDQERLKKAAVYLQQARVQ